MKIPSLSEIQHSLSQNKHQAGSSTVVSTKKDPTLSAEVSSYRTLLASTASSADSSDSTALINTLGKELSSIDEPESLSLVQLPKTPAKTSTENSPETLTLSAPSDALVDVVDIYLQQAEAYCDESQWEKAIAACKEALAIAPQAASVYKLLGNVLLRQGELTDAMGFYAKALAFQPGSAEIYSNLGSLYARKQSWKKAIAYFQKAIDQDPNFAAAHYNLAKVWKQLNNAEQELASLQTALKLQPDMGDADAHFRIGQALEAKEKVEAAIFFYRQTIERSPNFLPAYQRLVELLENQGDWQSAVGYYRKVVELTAQNTASSKLALSPQTATKANTAKKEQVNTPASQSAPQQTKVSLSKEDQQLVQKLLKASSTKRLIRPIPSQNNQPRNQQTNARISLSRSDQQLVRKLLKASSTKRLLRPITNGKASIQQPQFSKQTAPSQTSSSKLQDKSASQASEVAQLGMKYARTQDWPRAIHYFQQAIQAEPHSAILYRTMASALACNNQPQQAAMAWYRSFALDPDWPNAYQCLQVGNALFDQGKLDAAADCYKKAIRLQPQLNEPYQKLASLLKAQGDSDMAEAILQRMAKVVIEKESNKKEKNGSKAGKGKTKGTLASQTAARVNIEQALKLHEQGELLQKQEDWVSAIASYQKAIELNPTFFWSHHNLGSCYKELSYWTEAAKAYRQAISIKDDFLWSHYSLGEVLEHLKCWGEAVAAYNKALDIDPDSVQAKTKLAEALKQDANWNLQESAETYRQLAQRDGLDTDIYRQAISLNPSDTDMYKKLGRALSQEGKVDEAIFVYQTALQFDDGHFEILMQLSRLLEENGKLDEALECAQRAVAVQPDSFAAQMHLGNALSKQGNLVNALETFQRCLEIDAESPWVHQCMGNVHLWKGSLEEAIASYKQATVLEPTLAMAYKQMGDAYTGLGKVDEASEAYARAIEIDPEVAGV